MKQIAALTILFLALYGNLSKAEIVAEVGIDLHDVMTTPSRDPLEIWRKMRPQDFVGAPTLWQIVV